VHTLPRDEVPKEHDASLAERVDARRRGTVDPGAHRYDERGCVAKAVAAVSALACGVRELDARVGTQAAQSVEAVVGACGKRPSAEPVRDEVDRPQDHSVGPCGKAPYARKGVEAEPGVDARR